MSPVNDLARLEELFHLPPFQAAQDNWCHWKNIRRYTYLCNAIEPRVTGNPSIEISRWQLPLLLTFYSKCPIVLQTVYRRHS